MTDVSPEPAWMRADREFVWHPYTQHGIDPPPLPVVGAHGAWLELADGRRLLDAISSWWCCLHGHGHPRLVAAIARQAAQLDHVLFAGCAHEPAARLAERLIERAPPGLARCFFSDDGSTAVEVALKAAYLFHVRRGAPERTLFVALEGGYHGDTFGAMALGDPQPFFADLAPLLFTARRVPLRAEDLVAVCHEVRARLAGIVIEPHVQGAAGMRSVPSEVSRAARHICDETGALLIADEVMTGFGRTGRLFACEHAQVAPDLLCLSKGLTGGTLPLAATLTTAPIYDAFIARDRGRMFFHGHTYTANPIACAVALASLELLVEEDTPARFELLGHAIASGLLEHGLPAGCSLRRMGGIVAVEVDLPSPSSAVPRPAPPGSAAFRPLPPGSAGRWPALPPLPTSPPTAQGDCRPAPLPAPYLSAFAERLRHAARVHSPDVLLRPLGSVLYAMPPACTSPDEAHLIARRMSAVLAAALAT